MKTQEQEVSYTVDDYSLQEDIKYDEASSIMLEEKQACLPCLIGKFKAMSSIEDLERFVDTIENNHLYLPTYNQLNDPLEGTNTRLLNAEKLSEERQNVRERWRILSFTEEVFSPPMWAYYGKDFSGYCLVFRTDGPTFSDLEKVQYLDKQTQFTSDPGIAAYDDFFKKNTAWSYEKEWRIASEYPDSTNEKLFWKYEDSDIVAVILGFNIPNNVRELLTNKMKQFSIPVFVMKPNENGYNLMAYDNSSLVVDSMDALWNALRKS